MAASGASWDSYWAEIEDASNGSRYFWNHRKNVTVWEMPEGVKAMWVAQRSSSTGATYYINQVTQESTWAPHFVDPNAAKLQNESQQTLQLAFQRWDTNNNGIIDLFELQAILKKLGILGITEIMGLFETADVNGDGKIDYQDFMDFILCHAPFPVYYEVFSNLFVAVQKENGDIITYKQVQPADRVNSLFPLLKRIWKYGDQCRLFCRGSELTPTHQTFAEFGIVDNEKLTAVIVPKDYLKEYFSVLKGVIEEEFPKSMRDMDRLELIRLVYEKGDLSTYDNKMFADSICEEQLSPLMQKIFIQYDTARDGALGEEEMALIFEDFSRHSADFINFGAELVTNVVLEAIEDGALETGETLDRKAKDAKEAKDKELVKKVKRMLHEVNHHAEEERKGYALLKLSRDTAAMHVVDLNHDEQLQKTEIAAALMPTGQVHEAFMEALKLESFGATWARVLKHVDKNPYD